MTPTCSVTPFEDLSPSEKAVALAQDVLGFLARDVVQVKKRFGYIKIDDWAVDQLKAGGKSLKDMWRSLANLSRNDGYHQRSSCTVCGIGSLLLAYIDKENNFTIPTRRYNNTIADRPNVVAKLTGIFSPEQLDMIECAFEGTSLHIKFLDCYDPKIKASNEFAYRNYDLEPKERLKLIMQNIIENNGVFIP